MAIQHGFAPIAGGLLYYEVAGAGSPVILNHGFALDTRMWDDQFETFAQQHQVIRYDALGFGRSSLPNGPYSPTDDQAALMDHLGIEQAHIVGLSRGGGVAVDFAIDHPTRVRSLVAIDSTLNGYDWGSLNDDTRAVWSLGRRAPLADVKAAWLALGIFAPALEQPALAARIQQMTADYSGWHWQNRDQGQAPIPAAAGRLHEITVPTLIIVGERDTLGFRKFADALVNGIPHARKVVLSGVGHMANMEAPQVFNRIVLEFLADVDAQPPR
jgi:pimeloyl-ACP methyl ester carboxylesterase